VTDGKTAVVRPWCRHHWAGRIWCGWLCRTTREEASRLAALEALRRSHCCPRPHRLRIREANRAELGAEVDILDSIPPRYIAPRGSPRRRVSRSPGEMDVNYFGLLRSPRSSGRSCVSRCDGQSSGNRVGQLAVRLCLTNFPPPGPFRPRRRPRYRCRSAYAPRCARRRAVINVFRDDRR